MVNKKRGRPPTVTWAYAYAIAPPQAADRLRPIATLLARENAIARREARTWTARVVLEQHITHILVVSDSPDQDLGVNSRLEAGLRELQAGFSITVPMAVTDDTVKTPPTERPSGAEADDV